LNFKKNLIQQTEQQKTGKW